MIQPIDLINLENHDAGILNKYSFELLEKDAITIDYNGLKYLVIYKLDINKLSIAYIELNYVMDVYKKRVSGFVLVSEAQYYQIIERATQGHYSHIINKTSDVQKELENLLQIAVDAGASDLHITRGDVISKIEFRVNGALILHSQLTSSSCDELVFVLYNVEATTKETTWNRQQPQSANIIYDL